MENLKQKYLNKIEYLIILPEIWESQGSFGQSGKVRENQIRKNNRIAGIKQLLPDKVLLKINSTKKGNH